MNISIKNLEKDKILFNFKGSNIDNSSINTLRRIILSEIPTYAIPKYNIHIEKNTSVFDNDHMNLRISMLRIPNIKNDVNYFHKDGKYNQNKIEIYLNVVNNNPNILNVTTNDLTVYIDGTDIENPFDKEYPDLIIKLKSLEEFKFRATAVLGKASMHDLWAAATPCYFTEISENEYDFQFESLGQLTHKEILKKACAIIVEKLEEIETLIGDNYNDSSLDKTKKIILILENENHTMGNLITTALQNNPNVEYAGFKKDHMLINEITIRIDTINYNPLKSFFETISKLKTLYNKTIQNIDALDIKKIKNKK